MSKFKVPFNNVETVTQQKVISPGKRLTKTLLTSSLGIVMAATLAGCTVEEGPTDANVPAPDGAADTRTPEPDNSIDDSAGTNADSKDNADNFDKIVSLGDEINITDANISTVQCDNGGEIDIHVDGAEITFTGNCEQIEVLGNGSTITIESSDEIEIDGHKNTVRFEAVADLEIDGNDNTVEGGNIIKEIDIDGSNNSVTYTSGSPKIDDDGSGNSITG